MPRSTMRSTRIDLVVLLLIGTLGALQFALSCRAADYLFDTNYFELARSIASHAGYGFNDKPMTQLPPGLPYVLAWLGLTTSSSYSVVARLITVSATLALMTSYKLLSVQEGRGMAAVCGILLGSSPFLFEFSTRMVFTDLPYWFASMLLIYVALKLDALSTWRPLEVVLWVAWGVGLVATILVRSAAMSLIGGLCCWIVLAFLKNRKMGVLRLRRFMPAVIVAVVAQGSWMWWAQKHQVHEWSIPGYQENYVAQLRLKNANNPELGVASWKDIIARPIENSDNIGSAMFGLFTHKDMAPAWYSPGSVLPLLLMGLGLVYSFNECGLLELYFVSYVGMFLFWSWSFETRFLLPVAPLAFLYAWRGWNLLVRTAQSSRRLIAWSGLALAVAGCLSSIVWGRAVLHPQMRWCVAMWVLVGMVSLGLFWSGGTLIRRVLLTLRRPLLKGGSVTGWQAVGAVVLGFVVAGGVVSQIPIGLANLNSDVAKFSSYPDIEAAEWISAHSAQSSVIMARKDDIVYHYSRHRVIWFPASRDAALLMDGIRRYHVEYVVVRHGDDTYWQPTAEECFTALARAYPSSFRLVHTGPQNSVFEVVRGAMTSSRSVGAAAKEIAMPKSPPINSRRSRHWRVIVPIAVVSALAPLLWLAIRGGGDAPGVPASTPVRGTYATRFANEENPISEGRSWINGQAAGLDWANVRTTPGLAFGTDSGRVKYSDSTALLSGAWGPDQTVEGKVYSVNQNDSVYQEIELRLRSSLSAHRATGYEINFRCSKTKNAYTQIVRWNGRLGKFTYLNTATGSQYGVAGGDVVKATIVGTVITAYINGVRVLQATDKTYSGGSPGMGFYLEGASGVNRDFGFTNFTATDGFAADAKAITAAVGQSAPSVFPLRHWHLVGISPAAAASMDAEVSRRQRQYN